jgi:hypothetical protein
LKLKYAELLSKFAFDFKLRRYKAAEEAWQALPYPTSAQSVFQAGTYTRPRCSST